MNILGRIVAIAGFLALITCQAADVGAIFATPEAATEALVAAARTADRDALRRVLGLRSDELVAADQVQVSNELAAFVAAHDQQHQLRPESETQYVLDVGTDEWPFPIPIVQTNGGWYFDTDAGIEELLNRRIGRNELSVLQVVRAYVEAQRDYATRDRDGDRVLEYAQKLASSEGLKDGLYWPTSLEGDISPLGPLVAQARGEGYRKRSGDDVREPFHGYYFKILSRQGRHAPGGKYDYLINGNMIGGFALIAWPAQYGETGIMTFLVNQQGLVYQKDLGAKTSKRANAMTAYDPDQTWNESPE